MRSTTDTHAGQPFRWNTTAHHMAFDGTRIVVPARCTARTFVHLHPFRTPALLLSKLNPDLDILTSDGWRVLGVEQRSPLTE